MAITKLNGNKIVLVVVSMLITIGIAWGVLQKGVSEHSIRIKQVENGKLDKDLFNLHLRQSEAQFKNINNKLCTIDAKMDKLIFDNRGK